MLRPPWARAARPTPHRPTPSPCAGKSSERPVLDEAEVAANAASIASNVETLLQRVPGSTGEAPLVLDNYEWWSGMGLLDFLRDVGEAHGGW